MILINAIYFKGNWAQNFDKALTRKRYFYNSKKEKNLVEFMQSENEYYYFENEVIQAISLDYEKDNMEALIILPKNDNINDYIKNFNQKEYNNILECLNNEKVKLYLPKFELEFKKTLNDLLQNLGMKLAFDENNADFFNLFEKPEEEKNEINFYISEILQKTYITIDEEGTEAVAITSICVNIIGINRKRKISIMDINHPFLFIIRNQDLPSEHDILFIAKIEELKEKEKIGIECKRKSRSESKSRSRSRDRSRNKEE